VELHQEKANMQAITVDFHPCPDLLGLQEPQGHLVTREKRATRVEMVSQEEPVYQGRQVMSF